MCCWYLNDLEFDTKALVAMAGKKEFEALFFFLLPQIKLVPHSGLYAADDAAKFFFMSKATAAIANHKIII